MNIETIPVSGLGVAFNDEIVYAWIDYIVQSFAKMSQFMCL